MPVTKSTSTPTKRKLDANDVEPLKKKLKKEATLKTETKSKKGELVLYTPDGKSIQYKHLLELVTTTLNQQPFFADFWAHAKELLGLEWLIAVREKIVTKFSDIKRIAKKARNAKQKGQPITSTILTPINRTLHPDNFDDETGIHKVIGAKILTKVKEDAAFGASLRALIADCVENPSGRGKKSASDDEDVEDVEGEQEESGESAETGEDNVVTVDENENQQEELQLEEEEEEEQEEVKPKTKKTNKPAATTKKPAATNL